MSGCQNYAPFLGTLNNRCRIIIRTQKGTIILTNTHMLQEPSILGLLGGSGNLGSSYKYDNPN